MPIFKEELAKRIKGALMEDESWWYLCFNSDAGEFWVEHEWDRVDAYNLKKDADVGSRRMSLDGYAGPGADRIPEIQEKLKARAG